MTTKDQKDQHKAAAPATTEPEAAPPPEHAPPAPPPPPKMGRKVVQVAMDMDANMLIAVCVDGTMWGYGMGANVAHRGWTEFPIIPVDEAKAG